jgi:LysM repeat protein
MDTISRENNSLLPMAGVIVGVIGVLVGGYAAVGVSHLKTTQADLVTKVASIPDIQSQVQSAAAANDKVAHDIQVLQNSTQTAVNQLGTEIATIDEKLKHMEEMHAASKPAKAGKGGAAAPAVAGKGEYIVKAGDTGRKIANANGTTVSALTEVNPGISWSHLKVGQTIKLPEAAAAK